ncbi:glycosyl hydrolase family 28-related protein [Actinospica sp.]|jgi:hypothetical protein|uniref:glycosyl hydrolase family 28-related protein n=1 Tax=Actinospica sp. TaxID=1872142 RepID=UPI002C591DD2|nr:glycosyl hydrolase family 28-related protein [Actinospica sp.]HWG24103.1 glycosyl hydrolase family 28-related protein [Actinospica sp.]
MTDQNDAMPSHGATIRRRALIAGAAAGMTGTAIAASAAPASAATSSLGWYNVTDSSYNAKGDGTTDDTQAIQDAITACGKSGGGIVYLPTGNYLVTPPAATAPTQTGAALSVVYDNVTLMGDGRHATMLIKNGNGVLLSMSGTGSDPTAGSTHLRFCGIRDIGMSGHGHTGLLLQLYYAGDFLCENVYMVNNDDCCIDSAEFWDSRFYNLVVESCTGTAGSTIQPNVFLRNSAASSGYGYSSDSTNHIYLLSCRFESFGTGALAIGAGVNNANGAYMINVTDMKAESFLLQGPYVINVDNACAEIFLNHVFVYAGAFASGYSTRANGINWAARRSSLTDVMIGNGSVDTLSCGVNLTSQSESVAVLNNVIGNYTTAPATGHIYFYTSTGGTYDLNSCYANIGAQYAGTMPTIYQPGTPLLQYAGAVTDAVFAHTPPNGTMAIDTTGKKLYVRLGGAWLSTPLS